MLNEHGQLTIDNASACFTTGNRNETGNERVGRRFVCTTNCLYPVTAETDQRKPSFSGRPLLARAKLQRKRAFADAPFRFTRAS